MDGPSVRCRLRYLLTYNLGAMGGDASWELGKLGSASRLGEQVVALA